MRVSSRRLEAGQVVELRGEPPAPGVPEADPAVVVDVRYEDDDLVVVAKPPGLVVHPGAGHPSGTLVNGLLARFPDLRTVGEPARPGIVHRLDRETSGLLRDGHEFELRRVSLIWRRAVKDRQALDQLVHR